MKDYKKLIQSFLLFVGLFFLMDQVVGAALRSAFQSKSMGEFGRLNFILSEEKTFHRLIMGSSRALHHVDPMMLDDLSYNLSWDRTTIDYHLAILKLLEQNGKLPKQLLLHIDLSALCNPNIPFTAVESLAPYYDDCSWISSEIDKLSSYNSILYTMKSYRYNGKLNKLLKLKSDADSGQKRGYQPINTRKEDRSNLEKLLNKHSSSFHTSDYSMNPKFLDYLKKVIRITEQNKIQLILFTSPGMADYQYGDLMRDFKEFTDANQLVYLNYYQDDMLEKLGLDDFSYWQDLNHLNQKGAERFTHCLKRDLENANSVFSNR